MAISSAVRTAWAPVLQSRLQNRLVATEIADTTYVPLSSGVRTIKVIVLTDPTASTTDRILTDYDKDSADTNDVDSSDTDRQFLYNTSSDSSIDIVMDQNARSSWRVERLDNLQTMTNYVSEKVDRQGYLIRNVIDANILKHITDSITGTANVIGAANAVTNNPKTQTANDLFDHLTEAAVTLDNLNAPTEGRWIVLPHEVRNAWRNDTKIPQHTDGFGANVAQNGFLDVIAGFRVYTSNNLHQAHTGSLTAGQAVACPVGFPGSVQLVMQSPPRMTMMELEGWDAIGMRIITYYGRKVMRPESMVKMFVNTTA